MILITYLLAGIFAGLTAGLFGVGGGVVVVPVLIFAFESQGFSPEALTHMALGTSLATIVFTASSSAWIHNQKGAVLWVILKPMSLGVVVGAILGVWTVTQLDGDLLKNMFGIFAVIIATKMALKTGAKGSQTLSKWPVLTAAGFSIAWVSALFGIGGGTLTVPFLSRYQIEMRQVIGTAAACGFPIAFVGAVSNMLLGQDIPNRPEWTLGFVYLPALMGISLTSVYFAKLGANLAHFLPAKLLRTLFAIALMLVGIKFLLA